MGRCRGRPRTRWLRAATAVTGTVVDESLSLAERERAIKTGMLAAANATLGIVGVGA